MDRCRDRYLLQLKGMAVMDGWMDREVDLVRVDGGRS